MLLASPLLELKGVSVAYIDRKNRRKPLNNLSFQMEAGDLVVVLGHSGTGKSTLLDVVAGFIRPSRIPGSFATRAGAWLANKSKGIEMVGEVRIDGEDVTQEEPRHRNVGLVMQRFNLYPHMKVRNNLAFPLRMRGKSKAEQKEAVEQMASSLQIEEHLEKAPNQLSVGEQQRVAIAKMLLCEPRIALFDEAFSNLNWELRDFLYTTIVKKLVAANKGVIFVSHNLLDAVDATKILYMKRGVDHAETAISEFPKGQGTAWEEFETFLMEDSTLYKSHRERYVGVFSHTDRQTNSAFGHPVFSPIQVLEDTVLSEVLKPTFLNICGELETSSEGALWLTKRIWQRSNVPLETFEHRLQNDVNSVVPPGRLQGALERRSRNIADQVRPFIVGKSMADIGSGDGLVAWYLRDSMQDIVLTDVHSYMDERVDFPFYSYTEGQPLPLPEVDTALLLTVLHHAEDPVHLLNETRRITRVRAIIIESVFGVSNAIDGPASVLRGLDDQRQLKYQTFLDWVYNRVFHDGVPVPFNFNTPEAWRNVFEKTGWEIEHMIDLGIDQPIVPEHHFLFVLKPA
jgi:ABC-type sugar transport system ATPase subunit